MDFEQYNISHCQNDDTVKKEEVLFIVLLHQKTKLTREKVKETRHSGGTLKSPPYASMQTLVQGNLWRKINDETIIVTILAHSWSYLNSNIETIIIVTTSKIIK